MVVGIFKKHIMKKVFVFFADTNDILVLKFWFGSRFQGMKSTFNCKEAEKKYSNLSPTGSHLAIDKNWNICYLNWRRQLVFIQKARMPKSSSFELASVSNSHQYQKIRKIDKVFSRVLVTYIFKNWFGQILILTFNFGLLSEHKLVKQC